MARGEWPVPGVLGGAMTHSVASGLCLVIRAVSSAAFPRRTARFALATALLALALGLWPSAYNVAAIRQWLVGSGEWLAGQRKTLRSLAFCAAMVVVIFLIQPLITNHQSLVLAQTETATLSGIIQDPKGGVVPGVEVTVTRIETGTVATTRTNGAGIYVFTGLQPGHFRLLVRKEGFKEIAIEPFELYVQDKVEQNFSLEIGSISERVTVEGNGLVINTTDAAVSTTIDRHFAENLPLNGRSFQTLILLTPGTVVAIPQDNESHNGGQFSVNGQRANSNNWTVDGVSSLPSVGTTNDAHIGPGFNGANAGLTVAGTTQGLVSVDALQEFKIQTSSYAPEFGRQPGGQISLLTRSGTNGFHGTAFDYLRNDVLDANNWFNNATLDPTTGKSIPKGKERQNDFGATIGGPIFKDKTFFFFSYEGLRLLVPATEADVVPSLRVRQEAGTGFQPILNSFPIPQGPEFTTPCDPASDPTCPASGQAPTGSAPYTQSVSNPTNIDSYIIKVDRSWGQRVHLFAKYQDVSSDNGVAALVFFSGTSSRSKVVTLGTDISIKPQLANEFRLSYALTRTSLPITPFQEGGGKTFDTSILYPAPLRQSQDTVAFFVCIQDCFAFNNGAQETNSQRQINLTDALSYSVKTHQIKWGVDYRRLFPIIRQAPLQASYFVFSESDLIADNVSFAYDFAVQVSHPIYTNFSAYAQDTWRASNRLTLTYGLRWELNLAPGERDGIFPTNVIGLDNLANATLVPNAQPYRTTYGNFAPRVGLAYQLRRLPGRETVLRTGFGMFYDLNSEAFANGFGGLRLSNSSDTLTNLSFPVAANVFPIPPLPAPLTLPYQPSNAIDPHLQLPYTLQWNVSIEQALGHDQSVTASYVASAGSRLLRSDELYNFNPNFTTVTAVRNASSSNYQSLQLQYNRRLSRGLQALASYTYSHSIDNASNAEGLQSYSMGPLPNPNIDRGNSDFDLRHSFRGAATYNIPTWNANFFSKAILGGWSLQTIAVAQTSLPVDLIGNQYNPTNLTYFLRFPLRPNVVPGIPLYLYGAQCAAASGGLPCPGGKGFNPAAFTPVPTDANGNPTQTEGNLGRNVLRGFGAWQMDFALHRQFNLTERVNLQFRSEFFNVFNHPNFGRMNSALYQHPFGQAANTLNHSVSTTGLDQLYSLGGPRSVQLALKLSF